MEKVENKPEVKVSEVRYPRQISRIIIIKRKRLELNTSNPTKVKTAGETTNDSLLKIGSSFKGNSVLRGLTFDEESRLLPNILGVSSDSPNWEKTTLNYWANITKEIPSSGLELEVGLMYKTKQDYEYDLELNVNENGVKEDHKGIPINLSDYILYRYCLLYSRVANSIEDIDKSPKIEFYLYNKDKEISDKKIVLDLKRKAMQHLYANISDRQWVDFVLRVLIASDKSNKIQVTDINKFSEDEKDIALDNYLVENPTKFLAIAQDKNLEMKSFVEVCIATNKLQRIPNTDTISMDGNLLGNTTNEAILFLTNPKNNQVLNTLKAQTKLTL